MNYLFRAKFRDHPEYYIKVWREVTWDKDNAIPLGVTDKDKATLAMLDYWHYYQWLLDWNIILEGEYSDA